ncbi:MAG: hypothetical protein ICV67_08485 [Thermoleophilia bacterium]|nr:hypothetical protein [Thermoleophilia bacterium]
MYEWVLFLHVLSAFVAVAALTALWALVAATQPAAPLVGPDEARRYGRIGGPLVGIGMLGVLVFGVWLAIDHDRYELWDGWILAALVLWAVGGWAGDRAGKAFERDPVARRGSGITFQALNSVAVLVILVLMIWKPGA